MGRGLAGMQPAAAPAEGLELILVRIDAMKIDQLRATWREVLASEPPPAFSKDLLARAIAFCRQQKALGGLLPATARLLRSLVTPGVEPQRRIKVGSVIVREHKGVMHDVLAAPGWPSVTCGSWRCSPICRPALFKPSPKEPRLLTSPSPGSRETFRYPGPGRKSSSASSDPTPEQSEQASETQARKNCVGLPRPSPPYGRWSMQTGLGRRPGKFRRLEKRYWRPGAQNRHDPPGSVRSPISAPAKAHGMRGSPPHIAKSAHCRNAWLTTQSSRTGLARRNPWETGKVQGIFPENAFRC